MKRTIPSAAFDNVIGEKNAEIVFQLGYGGIPNEVIFDAKKWLRLHKFPITIDNEQKETYNDDDGIGDYERITQFSAKIKYESLIEILNGTTELVATLSELNYECTACYLEITVREIKLTEYSIMK